MSLSAPPLSKPISTRPLSPQDEIKVKLRVACGCGWSALPANDETTIVHGFDHAKETGHSLTITGEIRTLRNSY